jgi:zinc-binding alcohol dehydrogenase/oxidoreductase
VRAIVLTPMPTGRSNSSRPTWSSTRSGRRGRDSLSALKPGGRVVAFGATGGDQATIAVRPFYFGQFALLGTTMGSPRDFAGLLRMLDGGWRPSVEAVFGLDDAAAAHARMERRDGFGKLVLVP